MANNTLPTDKSMEYLKNDDAAITYLNEALNSNNKKMVTSALNHIFRVRGVSIHALAKSLYMVERTLYNKFYTDADLKLSVFKSILEVLGLEVCVIKSKGNDL